MKTSSEQLNLYNNLLKNYNSELDRDGVNGERIAYWLSKIADIGLTEDGGSNRIGFSTQERQAKDLVKQWMEQAGLEVREDGAGNVFGKVAGRDPSLPSILSGSHVDSVPNGGHFDGPLGVLAPLEIVEAWKETGYQPERSFEVVIFTDEEGVRFNGGLFGSRAFTGGVDKDKALQLKDFDNKPFSQVIDEYGLSLDDFFTPQFNKTQIEAYFEIHIEQGKRLEKENLPVGIVTGIAGPCWIEMTFSGVAGHAGNTPMDSRHDSLVAASDFIRQVSTLPETVSSTAVATVGKLNVFPNGVNVIPGKVELVVDIRDINEDMRDELVGLVVEKAKQTCTNYGVRLDWKESLRIQPIPVEEDILTKLEDAVKANGIKPCYMPSGAGHDAMVMGNHVPSAMFFVRSKNGVSHSPEEWSSLNDCVESVHVLKHVVENY